MNKKHKILTIAALVSGFISSIAVLLVGLTTINKEFSDRATIIVPIIFWVGLILEQIFIWTANSIRKKESRNIKCLPGIISFFKNSEGTVSTLVCAISFTVYVILMCLHKWDIIQFVLLFLVIATFRMHCILNGCNYEYIKKITEERT